MSKVVSYTIVDGDTLQSIAQRMLGDAGQWPSIALLNDLDYPFVVDLGDTQLPNTVTAGDIILLPDSLGTSDVTPSLDSSDPYNYGVDIYLGTDDVNLSYMEGGDLDIDQYGDLRIVSGLDCLEQDLIHRLITPQGSLPYHPEYGSRFLDIVGQRNTSTWENKALIELTKAFRSDPRVMDITNVTIQALDGGIINIGCTVVTSGATFNISRSLG